MPAPKKRYYSTAEVGEILGISQSKSNQIMHYFEKRGKLFRDGRIMRVKIEDFEEYLEERTTPPTMRRF